MQKLKGQTAGVGVVIGIIVLIVVILTGVMVSWSFINAVNDSGVLTSEGNDTLDTVADQVTTAFDILPILIIVLVMSAIIGTVLVAFTRIRA